MSLVTLPPAESPFIPGTTLQYAWDSVSLTAAMACWRRYYYKIILGLTPNGGGSAIALDFGIAFHKALEHYHVAKAEGYDHEQSTRIAVLLILENGHFRKLPTSQQVAEQAESTDDDDDGIHLRNSKPRTRYHLMRSVVWYLDQYADDPAQTLILSSGAPAVELSFRLPLPIQVGGRDMVLSGHIDRAVTFQSELYVTDYKTTKALSQQFFADFELSHQITGYTIAGKVVLDRPIAGAIIDGIALQMGGVQFGRKPLKRTDGQLEEYFETVQNTMDEAERHAESGLYPMNTSACYFCDMKAACAAAPEWREKHIELLYRRDQPWNPLENR